MKLQDRDFKTLNAIATYFLLNRHQIQPLCFPDDTEGRVTRRRLAAMVKAGYLRRPKQQVPSPIGGTVCPVYYLGAKGRDELAVRLDDPAILAKPVEPPPPAHLEHSLAVSQFQIVLRSAIKQNQTVKMEKWFNEREPINPLSTPEKYRTLFTELRNRPRLVCNPDAGFLLGREENRVVYYLERERGGTGAHQLYKRKHRGYDGLQRTKKHCEHFPDTTYRAGFSVLCVAQSAVHRKQLLKAFKGKPAAEFWRFAAASDLAVETILTSPIWYHAEKADPGPLIRSND